MIVIKCVTNIISAVRSDALPHGSQAAVGHDGVHSDNNHELRPRYFRAQDQ